MSTQEVRLERLRPAEITAALERAPVAWIPLGALEYHADHLPNGTDAVGAALHSTIALAGRGPRRLLPSHGAPMDDGPDALHALAGNLRQLSRLLAEIRRNRVWTMWPSSVDQPLTRVLPHLWVNAHSLANTYAVVDDPTCLPAGLLHDPHLIPGVAEHDVEAAVSRQPPDPGAAVSSLSLTS